MAYRVEIYEEEDGKDYKYTIFSERLPNLTEKFCNAIVELLWAFK